MFGIVGLHYRLDWFRCKELQINPLSPREDAWIGTDHLVSHLVFLLVSFVGFLGGAFF